MFQNLGMESTAAPVRAAGPGVSVARLPGGLLADDVLEQVAQREPVLVAVVAPRRAGTAKIAHRVVVHDGPGAACPGEAGDLEPGRAVPFALIIASVT